MTSKTALVTGASAGIGLAFAKNLASKGYNLVLCARRRKLLEEIASDLEGKFKVKVFVLVADLSLPETPHEIFKKLKEKNLTIDFLVNNAGYSLAKKFSQNSWEDIGKFLEVMMTSITKLCHLALPHMKKQNYGRIINVGSLAAYVPEDSGSLYTAVKCYVLSFSKALSKEFDGTNIKVLALCPGFTHTEFHEVLGNKEKVEKFPKVMWMDAETVVEEGYNAVMQGKRVHINGKLNRFISCLPEKAFSLIGSKKLIEESYKTN